MDQPELADLTFMDCVYRLNLEVVEGHFSRAAGIESGHAASEVFGIGDPIDVLAVDVET